MSTFRKDINGLRAIAVIAVVLFHFKPAWLSGGFAGVDVFFVISGFLMTGIISRGIEQDNFSILKFYVARANRIIPALAVLCLALMVFGWFYLTPLDYKTLGKHAAGSIGFLSNVLYWRESGYFDASSLEKWLLHTWSLSVEWQFYIIYPLILISVRKLFSVQAIKPVILLGTMLSFALCVYATYRWPTAAYYLLPTRAWEMMIGGVAYLYPISTSNRQKRVLELVGVALIIGSYFTVSAETLWPGYIALFPVLGSFLIIIARRNDSLITGNIVFQKIGLWSYSIYLWHWPLVVAIYSFSLDTRFIYLGMFFSVLLGFISYKYIESIRLISNLRGFFDFFKIYPLYIMFFVFLVSLSVYFNNGFLSRFDDFVGLEEIISNRDKAENYYRKELMKSFANRGEVYDDIDVCTLDGGQQTPETAIDCLSNKIGDGGFFIVGDSHGRDFLHSLKIAYPDTNFSMLHQSSCAPAHYKESGNECFTILDDVISGFLINNSKVKGVILSSVFTHDEGVLSMINDIDNSYYGEFPVYVTNVSPRIKAKGIKTVVDLSFRMSKVSDYYDISDGMHDEAVNVVNLNNMLSNIDDVFLFDKYSVFCNAYKCKLNSGFQPYFWDQGHLTMLGIEKVAERIKELDFLRINNN